MSTCQAKISELLEQCQNEWVKLESLAKEDKATISQTSKELREAIKSLVQLQDNLDETSTEMDQKANMLMDDVRKRLNFALNVTTKVKPTLSQSSPLISIKSKKTIEQPIKIIEEEEEEEEEIKETNLEPHTARPFGRRSLILDANNSTSLNVGNNNKNKSLFPLLKGLRPSQSLPVKRGEEVANINFYKNDDNFVFATDAIVDHPLRIGVGYGSYICYSCTIFSDKGTPITVRKRYSDFVELREELIKCYTYLKKSIPKLPPKKVVGKFTPVFVEQRRRELEYFFKYTVLHPTLGASPIVRRWIAP